MSNQKILNVVDDYAKDLTKQQSYDTIVYLCGIISSGLACNDDDKPKYISAMLKDCKTAVGAVSVRYDDRKTNNN